MWYPEKHLRKCWKEGCQLAKKSNKRKIENQLMAKKKKHSDTIKLNLTYQDHRCHSLGTVFRVCAIFSIYPQVKSVNIILGVYKKLLIFAVSSYTDT